MKNTLIKVLSFVMALTMIMSSLVVVATAADTAEHTHEYSETVVPATCISKGHTVYTCECGSYYLGNPTNALTECREEDLVDVPASEPTCTEPAYVAHKECALCGAVYGKTAVAGSKPNGHTLKAEIVDPDCGIEGGVKEVCQVEGCDYVRDAVIVPDADHPCTLAGHKVENYVYVITKAPTCTEPGKADYVCPVEGCNGGYRDITITKRGHNYGAAVVVNPDCLNAGSSTKTCAYCGDKQTTTISALGHDMKDVTDPTHACVINNPDVDVLFVDSTCYQKGYQWQHCTICDYLEKTTVPQKSHTWIEDADDKDADNNKTEYLYTYVVNQVTYTETSLARIISQLKAAGTYAECTTTVNGYKECFYCHTLEPVAAETRVAPGHTWESKVWTGTSAESSFCETKGWETIFDADHTTGKKPCVEGAKNYYIRECKVCDHEDNTYYFTVEHNQIYVCDDATCNTTKQITLYDGSKVTVDYCTDCTHTGRKAICYVCEADIKDAHFDAHNWVVKTENGEEVVVEEANCKLPAKYTWVCSNGDGCEQTRDEYKPEQIQYWTDTDNDGVYDWGEEAAFGYKQFLDANNHEPYNATTTKGVQYVAPTCISDGFMRGFCTWCATDVDVKYNKGEAYHNYVEIEAAVVPNCCETGKTATTKCSHCADVKGGELLPKDLETHKAGCTLGTSPVYTRYATCTVAYADMYQYSLCKQLKPINEGQVNPANHVKYEYDADFAIVNTFSYIQTVLAVDPTCTTTGMHAYTYCSECDYIVNVDTESCVYDDHRTNDTTFTCTENHGVCANIHCTKANHTKLEGYQEVVPADILAMKDASTGAYNSGKTITAKMVKAYTDANNKKADVAADFVIAALGHNFWFDKTVTKTTDTADNNILLVLLYATCTAPGNEWKIQCNRCTEIDPENNGETILPHGVKADKFHRFDDIEEPTCTEAGHKAGLFCDDCTKVTDPHGQACAVCNGNDYVLEATGHDLKVHKVVIGGLRVNVGVQNANCVNDGYVFKKCANGCDMTDATAWVCDGADFTPALGDENHTYLTEIIAPKCDEEGYDRHDCVNCGYSYTDNVKPALGHKDENGNTLLFNCKDYLVNRGTTCAVCRETVNVNDGEVVDGLNNAAIDHNYEEVVILPGCEVDGQTTYVCADCGHTKQEKNAAGEWEDIVIEHLATGHDVVDIIDGVPATPAANGYWTWKCGNCGEQFTEILYYTRDVEFDITVAPYIAGKDSADLTFVNGGYIEVLLTVSTEDLVFSAFEYVLAYNDDILTFDSAEFIFNFGSNYYISNNGDNVSVSGWFSGDKTGTFDGLDVAVLKVIFKVAPGVYEITDDDIYTAFVEFNAAAEETIDGMYYNDIEEDIELALMGDLNGDNRYSMEDVKMLKDLVGGEYNNVADIDNNGVVELKDFALLVAFVTSNQTILDYYKMFGVDISALADAYDHNDYNGDGQITNVDAKIFKDEVVKLGKYSWDAVVYDELGDFTVVLDMLDADLLP